MKKIYLLFFALFACIFFFTSCKNEEYVVTFNPNGGKGTLITQNFTQKVAQPLMANSFTNRGYTFKNWNTSADGLGDIYQNQDLIKVSGHMVLYAQWVPVSGNVTVTFKANGGTEEMPPQIFEAGVTQELNPNRFYFENHKFTGWNTSANGKGKSFENEQNISITADMTLYAQWMRENVYNTFFVHFKANGGEGTMEPQKFKEFEYQMLDSNTFIRTDCFFRCWNTDENGLGINYQDNEEIKIFANTVLYAQWDSIPEKIKKH